MKKLVSFGITVLLIGIVSCAFSTKQTKISRNQFDKVFDKAVEAGAGIGYSPAYQDKENGAIDLVNKIGSNEYRIKIRFYQTTVDATDDLIVRVSGESANDIVNPFISGDVDKILKAIEETIEETIK